jgi:TonB family protein
MAATMNSAAVRADWSGHLVGGKFPLLEWLGGSEQSSVYLTEFDEDGTKQAVINLIASDAVNAEARFAGWSVMMGLSHPHLMRVIAYGQCEIDGIQQLYVVTEHADEVLSEIIPQRRLTPQETKEMLGTVLDALSDLHERGFVHGHIKPRNIMAVGDDLKLSADNICVEGELASEYRARTVYDAPEAATDPMSPAMDVWSLGMTLVEVLTQHLPLWQRAIDGEPVVPEGMLEPFAEIARECMRIDAERRCTLRDIRTRIDSTRSLLETITETPGKKVVAETPKKKRAADLPERTPEEAPQPSERVFGRGFGVAGMIGAALLACALAAVITTRTHEKHGPRPAQSIPAAHTAPAAQPGAAQPAKASEASAPAQPARPAAAEAQAVPKPVPVQAQQPAPTPQKAGSGQTAAVPPQIAPALKAISGGATEKGGVRVHVLPDVLTSARATIQGTLKVSVQVTVNANGAVTDATFDSQGPSKYFSKVALAAARQWKFKPAQVDGNAVASTWDLQFQFTQTGTEVTPVETAP